MNFESWSGGQFASARGGQFGSAKGGHIKSAVGGQVDRRLQYWTFLLKLSPDRPSWTIQASFSNNQGPFHWRNRFLRIEEIKRLQTFDDNYILKGDFKEQWRQTGNAVPPLIAEIFANKIKKII